jgi:hypothetical protein
MRHPPHDFQKVGSVRANGKLGVAFREFHKSLDVRLKALNVFKRQMGIGESWSVEGLTGPAHVSGCVGGTGLELMQLLLKMLAKVTRQVFAPALGLILFKGLEKLLKFILIN